jgi:hypothetical protein
VRIIPEGNQDFDSSSNRFLVSLYLRNSRFLSFMSKSFRAFRRRDSSKRTTSVTAGCDRLIFMGSDMVMMREMFVSYMSPG